MQNQAIPQVPRRHAIFDVEFEACPISLPLLLVIVSAIPNAMFLNAQFIRRRSDG
ncbi:MAG: hypothetical protein KF851_16550 [Pirellulaceae bacterium]|nr:hypothetical protein [Pirellulaceae bacterium]